MAAKWTDSQIVQLIELWHSYPAIWDTRDSSYLDRNKAKQCILTICRSMGFPEEEVRRKLKCLRTQYVQQLHTCDASFRSGEAAASIQEPTWKFFGLLNFLRPCVQLHSGKSNLGNRAQLKRRKMQQEGSQLQDEFEDSPLQDEDSQFEDERFMQGVSAAEPYWQNSASVPGLHTPSSATPASSPSLSWQPLPHTSLPMPSAPMPSSQGVLNPAMQEATCSIRTITKKRKRNAGEEAVYVLKTMAPKRSSIVEPVEGENEHFFKMMAYKVSRLPIQHQDRLRRKIYNLVADEQEYSQE